MEVTYQITQQDLRRAMRCLPLARRVGWQYGWILQLLLCTVPGAVSLLLVGEFLVPLAMWGLLVLLIAIRWLAVRTRRDPEIVYAPPITLRTAPDFLETRSDQGGVRRQCWSQVARVIANSDVVAFGLSGRRVLAVPRRAFATVEHMERFVGEARQYILQARRQPRTGPLELPPPDVPPPNVPSPGVPSLDAPSPNALPTDGLTAGHNPIRVRYQNTARQVVRFRHHGLSKPTSPLWGGLTAIVLTFAMTAALFASQGPTRLDRMVPSVLFMFLSTFTTLWISTLLRPILDRARVEPELLQPLTLTLDAQGVSLESAMNSSWESWHAFQQPRWNEEFLVLARWGRQDAYLIPRTAFRSAAEASDAERLIRECVAQAQAQSPEQNEQSWHDPYPAPSSLGSETGNPYQPPSI